MYKYITGISVAMLMALSMLSCSKEEASHDAEDQTGYLYVSLKQDVTVDPVFKNTASGDPAFALVIYDRKDEVVATYDDYRDLAASPLEVRAGEYRVTASSAPAGVAAFDAPFYSGETKVIVRGNQVNTATITCTMANVKVTAELSDEMKSLFSEYLLTVSNGDGALVYSSLDGTFSNEGYFTVTDHLTWTLQLKNVEGTSFEEVSETYTDIKPRQHYNLQFSLAEPEEFGGTEVAVTLNGETSDKTYNLLLDFEADVRPTVTASFDMNREVEFAEGTAVEAKFHLNIPGGANYIEMSHANTALSSNSLPYNFRLMRLSESDRTYYADRGIILPSIQNGDTSVELDLSGLFLRLPIGEYSIRFYIESNNGKYRTQYCNFSVVSAVEVEAVSVVPWAKFAILSAKWYPDQQPEGISFQYRKQAGSDWIEVPQEDVVANVPAKTFVAEIYGLDASTAYVFRAVSAKDTETRQMTFTTESASVVPNMGFDSWYKNGSIWYPNSDSGNFYWDTANGGSDAVGVYPTSPEDSHVISGRAAKLESKSVALVGLAAGNVYTGKFVKANTSLTNPGAELDWGVSFGSRPLALKGYIDYRPGTINKTKAPYSNMSGKADIGIVQVFITDWSGPFRISTSSGKFVDTANDAGIIAHGTLDFGKTDGYVEFTIPLTYRSTTRQPKYIVIAAAASKYGDYFTGSTSSVMYVDEFRFVYDPSELTEEQLSKVKYK